MQNMLKMDFSHVFLFMVVSLLLLLAPEIAHAIPVPPGFEVPETDKSRVLLKMLLGDIVDVADGASNSVESSTAITQVLASIAPVVSITGVLLMTYTMLVGVMNTANEGETLGRKWSTIWIPARSSAAMAFILPVPTFGGLSGIQLVVVWLTLIGSGGANIVWNASADAFTAEPVYQQPLMIDTSMMTAILTASACSALHEKYMSDTGYVATGDARGAVPGLAETGGGLRNIDEFDKTLKNGVIQRTYKWKNQGSPVTCGSISFPIGYSPDTSVTVNSNEYSGFGGFFRGAWDRTTQGFNSDAERRIREAEALRQNVTSTYAQTIYDTVTRVDTIAYNMVMSPEANAKDVDYNALYQLVQWYGQETTKVAREDASESISAMSEQFKDDVERDGWALAGVYFWRLVMMQEALNEAVNEGTDATAAEGVDFTDSVDFETLSATYPIYAERINEANSYISAVGMSGQSAAQDALADETWRDIGPFDAIFSSAGRMVLGWISESSDNPLMALKNFGDKILMLIGSILVIIGVAKVLMMVVPIGRAVKGAASALGGMGNGKVGKIGKALTGEVSGYMMFAIIAIVIALFVMAFMFAYYLPAIPYVIWVAAIMGWLIYTMEALIAAPLWIVMHAHPDGEGPSGSHGAPGYMILLSLVLRPTLLIIGLVTSLGILYVMGWFLKETLIMSQSYLDPESSRGFFANISIIILYCAILYKIINESFEQIHSLASSVMGWIGGSAKNLGEAGAQNEVKSTVIAGAGVVKQATQANMAGGMANSGAKAVKDAVGKGGNTPQADNVMDKPLSGGLSQYAKSIPTSTQTASPSSPTSKKE